MIKLTKALYGDIGQIFSTMMDESTEDSFNESLCDANLEELKEQWTLKQLELSKQVSEVLNDQ